ncbi:MAG: radical SAM protein [Candidatus Omnitrophota bacterium]|jgi:radical SAM superfamily enzyme YgiQ (UPF0313 family)
MANGPKILLVNLPWQKDGSWGVRAGSRWPHLKDKSEADYMPFPFFLAYASSLLKKNAFDSKVIDCPAERMDEDAFMDNIRSIAPGLIVAETSIPSFNFDMKVLKGLACPGRAIILCGPNSLIYDEAFLKEHSYIDYVLRAEYEFTLLELVRSRLTGGDLRRVKGIVYRDKGRIIKTPDREPFDVDLLPWPDRAGLPMEKYLDAPGEMPTPSVQMLASRGCPFGCNFCLWPQVMYRGRHYRARAVKDVVDEMEYLVRERKFKSVYFDDDTWNIGRERILDFCKEVKKRGLHTTPWAIMARADLMDKEVLAELKSAGLWAVKYGVESCAQDLVKRSNKNMRLKDSFRMIAFTKALGIKVHLTFCFGLDGETKETVHESIKQALGLGPDSVQFSILTPFPGTALFELLDKSGRILTRDWSKYDGHYHCVFQPDRLGPGDLEQAKARAYQIWAEYSKKRIGPLAGLKRFVFYMRAKGPGFAVSRAFNYIRH